jgi:hypothetical protein
MYPPVPSRWHRLAITPPANFSASYTLLRIYAPDGCFDRGEVVDRPSCNRFPLYHCRDMAAKDEVMPVETKPAWPDHFRYIDSIGPEGVTIVCRRYVVIRESEHCYWLVPEGSESYAMARQEATGKVWGNAKRVSKNSWRRFAYPGKEEALSSYKARKRHQLSHAELALERAKAALADIKDMEAINDQHVCAGGDYIKQLNWVDC